MLGGGSSYSVCWARLGDPPAIGKVVPSGATLELSGTVGGRTVSDSVSPIQIASARIERTGPKRLRDQPTIVLELHGQPPILILPLSPGALHQLTNLLAELASLEQQHEVAVVLPLKPDTLASAQERLALGPPFDPASVRLLHHTVFLSPAEAVFVFSGDHAAQIVLEITLNPSNWAATNCWADLLAGPARLALPSYSWTATQAAPTP